ncbi:MAG: ATP-binding protein [Deltaproteobacteria bacterium]|nr:ATP-binding protein [Deltaproteobacteria bacterium]
MELLLRRMNPWWAGQPMQILPPHRRHLVAQIKRRLDSRVAPIIVVRGARQIGKTTSQMHVLSDLLASGVEGKRVLRVQFDDLGALDAVGVDPIIRIVDWFEHVVLGESLNEAAAAGRPTYLFLDEVQNLSGWAPQLKALVDTSSTQVVVTGSSALRLELGRDSLAGRINTIEAGVLSLTEIAALRDIPLGAPSLADNGLGPLAQVEFWQELRRRGVREAAARDSVFAFFSERGGYPIGHARADVTWPQIADQLNETVVKRVIQHDLRLGERGRRRDEALLQEVFRLACRYAGQAPPIHTLAEDARQVFGANLGDNRVRQYLRFLSEALLIRAIEPLEIRLKKKRGSPKLCLVDHALRASWLQEVVPLVPAELTQQPALSTLAGRVAESVVGAVLSTIVGLDIAHVPERGGDAEIDFVITVGTRRIPIEVKYQATPDPVRDVAGLRSFVRRTVNNAPFGVVITQSDTDIDFGPDIVALPLSSMMLLR